MGGHQHARPKRQYEPGPESMTGRRRGPHGAGHKPCLVLEDAHKKCVGYRTTLLTYLLVWLPSCQCKTASAGNEQLAAIFFRISSVTILTYDRACKDALQVQASIVSAGQWIVLVQSPVAVPAATRVPKCDGTKTADITVTTYPFFHYGEDYSHMLLSFVFATNIMWSSAFIHDYLRSHIQSPHHNSSLQ